MSADIYIDIIYNIYWHVSKIVVFLQPSQKIPFCVSFLHELNIILRCERTAGTLRIWLGELPVFS